MQPGHGSGYSSIMPQTMLRQRTAASPESVFVLIQGERWAHSMNMCNYFKMEHVFIEMKQVQM